MREGFGDCLSNANPSAEFRRPPLRATHGGFRFGTPVPHGQGNAARGAARRIEPLYCKIASQDARCRARPLADF